MIVNLLGRLDASVPQAVPHVVQRVILLGVHHPVGDTMTKCMRRYVVRITASSVDQVRLDASFLSDLRDRVPNTLGSDPAARPRGEQRWRVLPPAIQVRRQQSCNV